jgi:transposase-like protein
MEAEMTEHLRYNKYEHSDSINSRNGRKTKTIHSKYGETTIELPLDRYASFEPKIVKKRQKNISAIDDKIISMYAKSITTRQISE